MNGVSTWYTQLWRVNKLLALLAIPALLYSCSQMENQSASHQKKALPAAGIIPLNNTLAAPLVQLLDTGVRPLIVPTLSYSGRYNYYNDTFLLKPPATRPAGSWSHITTLNADDGLFSSILCMHEDRSGHLWFGTDGGGAIRYDGKTFTTYTKTNGLCGDRILSISEDKDGNICFCTMEGGLSVFDGKKFSTYNIAQLGISYSNNKAISKVHTDSLGNTWFGTYGGGVSRFDGKTYQVFTTAQGLGWTCNGDCLGSDFFFDILEDKIGSLWFCLGGGGASHYDGKKFTNYGKEQGLGDNIVRCAIKDKHGNIWFGTGGGGASCYDGQTMKTYTSNDGLANNDVYAILEDDRGKLWFATNGGVSRFDGSSFTTLTIANGLADNRVTSIVQDKSGSIWFGTMGGGASRYDRDAFTTFAVKEGLPGSRVTSIAQDNTGNMWFGIAGEGIIRYNGSSFTSFSGSQGLPFGFVESIDVDKDNHLWVGTGGTGVTRFDGTTATTYDDAQLLPNRTVYDILEDRHGGKWFSTFNGVCHLEGKKRTSYNVAQGLCHSYIVCMAEDKNGNIWFGSQGGGISKFDGQCFTNYTVAQGLPSNVVPAMLVDKNGNLWLGSDGFGVTRYDGQNFMTYTVTNGLANNYVLSLVEDKRGIVWAGTNEGFSGITGYNANHNIKPALPADNPINNTTIAHGYTPKFETYNFKNGYPVRNVKTRAMFADRDDIIWAGAGDLLVRFDRDGIYHDTTPPKLFLKSIKINGKNMLWHALQHNTNKPASNSLAEQNEEVATFGIKIAKDVKDSMRSEFVDVSFDSIGKFYPVPYALVLPYRHNNITFDFGAIHLSRANLIRYQYMLEGYDETWAPLTDKTSVTFGNMHEGTYTFKVKALSPEGVWSKPLLYTFKILPPLYRTWWAYSIYAILTAMAVGLLLRWRTRQLIKEKALLETIVEERTVDLVKEKTEVEKQKKLADVLLVQKDMLMKEIHHRVKNNLQVISTLLDLQLDNIKDIVARKAISEGMGRIKSISLIHQQLYQGDDMTGIELPKFTQDLMLQVTALFKKPGQNISLTHDVTNKMLDIDTAVPLGLIMNELMTNSYKYAFTNGDSGSIDIKIREAAGHYTLIYRDSGPGLPTGFNMRTSSTLGGMVITNLSKQLGGDFNYNEETKEFLITFVDITERKKVE